MYIITHIYIYIILCSIDIFINVCMCCLLPVPFFITCSLSRRSMKLYRLDPRFEVESSSELEKAYPGVGRCHPQKLYKNCKLQQHEMRIFNYVEQMCYIGLDSD